MSVEGKRSREGVVRISTLDVENPAGGTVLKLKGGLDFGDERRSLSLRGTLYDASLTCGITFSTV